jgi:hypothetical protein
MSSVEVAAEDDDRELRRKEDSADAAVPMASVERRRIGKEISSLVWHVRGLSIISFRMTGVNRLL